MPVSPGCPANRAKRASRLVTRTRTVNPRIIRHILSGVASSLAITQRRWHALLAGTRGIEPPFSPLAALTSNEWLALWYTRSRRAFPCSARLSGLPNGDNCLLIDRYNRNDAMQLVGLRSGLPKTHPSVQCRTAILHHARLGIEPARLGDRTPLHTATAPSLRPVSTEHWRGVSESNRLLLSLRSATVREWLAPYNNPAYAPVFPGCHRLPQSTAHNRKHGSRSVVRSFFFAKTIHTKRECRKKRRFFVARRCGTAPWRYGACLTEKPW